MRKVSKMKTAPIRKAFMRKKKHLRNRDTEF
jgi:hypothetical protein